MANVSVAGMEAAPQGQVLQVTDKGQEAEITAPPDGSVSATRVTLEKDGVKPLM